MPELGEVAHEVALLKKYVLNQKITSIDAPEDNLLYKPPLTNQTLYNALLNKTVTDIGRNGKYFWFILNDGLIVLMHLGMTGWIHVKDVHSHYIPMESGGDRKQREMMEKMEGKEPQWGAEEWPPRFHKLLFGTESNSFAFIDPRRLARIRVFQNLDEMQRSDPISKLGPDYSINPLQFDQFFSLISKRKVSLKLLLLNQSLFSGIGNWMADEILHLARIYPEQRANTIGLERAESLYKNIVLVCKVAAETEGNTSKFPGNWLMLHRWGKARSKKEVQKTPEGFVVDFVTIGGRTSCYIPELQKLEEGPKEEPKVEPKEDPKEDPKVVKRKSRAQKTDDKRDHNDEDDHKIKEEQVDEVETEDTKPKRSKRRRVNKQDV